MNNLIITLLLVVNLNLSAQEINCSSEKECWSKMMQALVDGSGKSILFFTEKHCEFGSANSCLDTATYYRDGTYSAKNRKLALKHFKKACDMNEITACDNLSKMLKNSTHNDDLKEHKKLTKKVNDYNRRTLETLKSTCIKKKTKHYYKQCSRLGYAYYKEQYGLNRDIKKAINYMKIGCQNKSSLTCLILGQIYHDGQYIRQDKSSAKEYYGIACDLGESSGCKEYRTLNEQGIK